jgi:hypothetical protein
VKAGKNPTLAGYIFWAYRTKTAELEEKYTQKFTELLGYTVQVSSAENIIIPSRLAFLIVSIKHTTTTQESMYLSPLQITKTPPRTRRRPIIYELG